MNALQILRQYWGHSQFRPLQEDIIESVLKGNDTLALLPTGGGKSICFQVPGLMKEGICLVISPLIALMKDQVENLKSRGIKATAIFSGMHASEVDVAFDNCIHGRIQFLYLSPERLLTDLARARIAQMKINLIAVDEAHCISQWGYDFRPSYMQIASIRELHPHVPVIALTASATLDVQEDIMDKLQFNNRAIFRKSFERKNLSYVVFFEEDKFTRMLTVIRNVSGSGIVYVKSRKKTRELAEFLEYHQVSAHYYHAGLEQAQRHKKQDEWLQGKVRAMVATNAFGMGIDKPDVRWVIHFDIPDNLESYYQEAGRAGRDEKTAFAVLFYQQLDLDNLIHGIALNYPSQEEIKKVYQALSNFLQVPIGSGLGISYDFNFSVFCEQYKLDSLKTYSCLRLLEMEGYIVSGEVFNQQSKIHIHINGTDLYNFQVEQAGYDQFIKVLLRSYEGLFDDFVAIRESDIAKRSGMTPDGVVRSLKYLEQVNILKYLPVKESPQLVFTIPREDADRIHISKENLQFRKERAEMRLKAMLQYVTEKNRCRSQLLLHYFGEESMLRCGVCDYCRNRNKLDLNDMEFKGIRDKIKVTVIHKHLPLNELVHQIHVTNEDKALKVIQWLLDNENLRYTNRQELEWVD